MLVHKTNFNKLKIIKIILSNVSNHHSMKLEMNYMEHKHMETKKHATKQSMSQ